MSIVKININGTQVLAAKVTEGLYADINGRLQRCQPDKVSRTRNVPEGVKQSFREILSLYKNQLKMKEDFARYQELYNLDLRSNMQQINAASAAARAAAGILSREEFENAFYDSLPEDAREEIETKGFRIGEPDGIGYSGRSFYLCYHHQIGKWVNNISYTYREYDGQLFIVDEPEKNKEYKTHLKKYGRRLSSVSSKFQCQEYIYAGDKDSLWYGCCYEFPLPETMTKDAALALVNKAFPQKAGR